MSVYLSMAAFALVASITPGPVNLVALGSAAQYGLMPALRHVLGATLGFVLLLVLSGFGLHQLLDAAGLATRYPVGGRGVLVVDGVATGAGRWPAQCPFAAAAAVLVVWRLDAMAEPQSVGGCAGGHERICGRWRSRADLAICRAVSGDLLRLGGQLAYAGSHLRRYLQQPARVRQFNRLMALLLLGSAALLAV